MIDAIKSKLPAFMIVLGLLSPVSAYAEDIDLAAISAQINAELQQVALLANEDNRHALPFRDNSALEQISLQCSIGSGSQRREDHTIAEFCDGSWQNHPNLEVDVAFSNAAQFNSINRGLQSAF